VAKTTVTQYCSSNCASRASKKRAKQAKISQSDAETSSIHRIKIEELNAREYLTIEDICLLTKVSRWTIWRAIRSNKLQAGKLGRRVLIRKKDLEACFLSPGQDLSKEPKVEPLLVQTTDQSYSMSEVMNIFKISDKALRAIIKRNNIPVIKRGRFTFVSKTAIDRIFK
jgi:excisionase family DNA binding protein